MIEIYSDGACSKNPGGPGGWGAILVRDGKFAEYGGFSSCTTNNIMEMTGALEGLRVALKYPDDIVVYTDSKYLRNGITAWLENWKRKGWKTSAGEDVKNREIWEELDRLSEGRVTWKWVKGHADDVFNCRADEIARTFSSGGKPVLRRGPVCGFHRHPEKYPPSDPDSMYPGGKVYLSLVSGELARHRSWEQCRRRIEGVKGARKKACRNFTEESDIIKEWGLSLEELVTARERQEN